jgi:hypothetical protein
MLDCDKLRPFDVIRFPTEFEGDPDRIPKIFIVANNLVEHEMLQLFKPTSQTKYYDVEPSRLKGVVEYLPGEIDCFPVRTLIDPQSYNFHYAYIRACHRKGEFQYLGRLPDDFREKMNAAVINKPEWRKKNREWFFLWFR